MKQHIAVLGANGRMGQALIKTCEQTASAQLSAAIVRETSPLIEQKVAQLVPEHTEGLAFSTLNNPVNADVLIDFTLPEGMLAHLAYARQHKIPMVIGTTGLTEQQHAQLVAAAQHIPIVFARNYSVGVNVLLNLVQTAAVKMGEQLDIEIFEAHHRHKIDSPSGTALAIGESIAQAKGWQHDQVACFDRSTQTQPKSQKEIGYSVVRAGEIVGEHTAYFATLGEQLELTHKATSRMTFASGAVRAALWLRDKPAGLYNMQDVLGLSEFS